MISIVTNFSLHLVGILHMTLCFLNIFSFFSHFCHSWKVVNLYLQKISSDSTHVASKAVEACQLLQKKDQAKVVRTYYCHRIIFSLQNFTMFDHCLSSMCHLTEEAMPLFRYYMNTIILWFRRIAARNSVKLTAIIAVI